MRVLRSSVEKIVTEEDATETLEWALIAGLVVVGGLAALYALGPKITQMWNNINTAIQ